MMALSRLPYDNGMPNAVAGNLPFPQRYAGFICVVSMTILMSSGLADVPGPTFCGHYSQQIIWKACLSQKAVLSYASNAIFEKEC